MDSWRWYFLLGVVCLLIDISSAQVKRDKGVVLTMWPDSSNGAKVRSINFMPGYGDVDKGNQPSALRFLNRNIDLLSVDVDYRMNRIYFYDAYLNSIVIGVNYNTSMVTSGDQPLTFDHLHRGTAGGKLQLAFDWLSHTIYWTDSVFQWIAAAPGSPDKVPMDYYKLIVSEDLQEPCGLAIDPINGYMYFSDIGANPTIERAMLNGEGRTKLLVKGLSYPHTLEWDHWDQRLYWIDFDKETIQWLTFNGDVVKHNFNRRLANRELYDIAVFKEVVYVTDVSQADGIYTINKTTGYMVESKLSIRGETAQALAVFNIESQPMTTDYCAALNCSHICISKKNGAECACSDGFKLATDSRNCEDDAGAFHKAFVYSTKNSICVVDLRTLFNFYYLPVCILYTRDAIPEINDTKANTSSIDTSNSTASPNNTATAAPTKPDPSTTPAPVVTSNIDRDIMFIDVDTRNRRIFFATNDSLYQIPVEVVKGRSLIERLVVNTNGVPSGLQYDWTDNNIYWSEANTGKIKVHSLDTGSTREIASNEDQPTSLALLPHQRALMWIAGTTGNFTIRSGKINGLGLRTVVKSSVLINPMSLTRDPSQPNRVFWLDNRVAMSANVDRSNLTRTLLSTTSAHLLHIYKGLMIYTSNDNNEGLSQVYVEHIQFGTLETSGTFNNSTLTDITILDDQTQPDGPHACTFNDACDQICLSVNSSKAGQLAKRCECQVGYTLVNETVCTSYPVKDNFMLVADRDLGEVFQITLDGTNVQAVVKSKDGLPTGILFDRRTKQMIYGVQDNIFINSISLDGKTLTRLGYIRERGSYPYRFALDETTGNLYYTTKGVFSVVAVLTPSKYHMRLVTGTGDLGDIVVHPKKGYMFWSETRSNQPSFINRAGMDGTKKRAILSNSNVIRWPNGLAIDYIHDLLYFSDEFYDTISFCDFDGNNIKQLTFDRNAYILGIGVDGTNLYYTSTNRMYIKKVPMNKIDQTPTTIHESPGMGQLEAIDVYMSGSANVQSKNGGCMTNNGLGRCTTACFPTPIGSRCACDLAGSLSFNVAGCQPVPDCKISELRSKYVDVIPPCETSVGSLCIFTCKDGFEPVDDENTTACTASGWVFKKPKPCQPVAPVVTSPAPKPEKRTRSSAPIVGGVIGGLAILLLILAAVMFFFCRRRMMKRYSEGGPRAVFSGGPNIAIENPGYGGFKTPEEPQAVQRQQEEPHYIVPNFSTLARPVGAEASSTATNGYVTPENPYDNMKTDETIGIPTEEAEEEEPEVDADDVVLTQDSWLREQAKAKEGGFVTEA